MKEQMTAIIVRDSEGFFDDPKESEDLQITVRAACEFFVFLRQSNDVPELGDAEYMAGTIRSGLDWFFSMASENRSTGGKDSEPDASLHSFFDLHNVAIKAVKTDLPFSFSFFVEYA